MGSDAEKQDELAHSPTSWAWPLDVTRYDRTPTLSQDEREALMLFVKQPRDRTAVVVKAEQQGKLVRLILPLLIDGY